MSGIIEEIIGLNKELQRKLEKVLENHNCPKNHTCLKKTVEEICPVCPLGTTNLLECLNCQNNTCKYLYRIGEKSFCECEVRIFIQ